MADAEGIRLVINARTDVCRVDGSSAHCLRHAIDRGNACREPGADGIFGGISRC
jgi:2-methylisocitrate lyase-like PEP mutase family enzyme